MSDIHSLSGVTEAKAKSVIRQHRKASFYVKKYLMIFVGALIAAIGLELFLIPNNVIDGGVVGISIMMSSITGLSLGVFLVLLNIPFLYLGYKQIGKNFAIATTIAICILSVWSAVFAPLPKVTDDPFLAAIFGGIIDGLGVGLIIRAGGSLDGTEIVAIIMDRKSVFSVGEVVMFIDEITSALNDRLGRGVTLLHGQGGYTGEPKEVLYCVVTRLEVDKLKEIVLEKDENAFVTINAVHDIVGGRFKKKAIH